MAGIMQLHVGEGYTTTTIVRQHCQIREIVNRANVTLSRRPRIADGRLEAMPKPENPIPTSPQYSGSPQPRIILTQIQAWIVDRGS